MLHRSSTDDIVDRPNDDRVEISLMIIYYITNCTIYYYLFIMSSVSDVIAEQL